MNKGKTTAAIALLLTLTSWLLPASGTAQTQQEVIEGAKKEGKVSWYGSLSLEDVTKLSQAFEKKYPFIKVEPFRASGEKLANKILTETRAGRYSYDVLATGAFEIWPLYKRNLVGKYISPESKPYAKEFKDPEGSWTDLYDNYYVIGYNSKMVAKKDAPATYEALLDPKWKGKFAMDPEDYEWYMALLSFWGEEKGKAYMKRLAKQDIQWRKGHTLLAQQMIAGEFPASLIYAHRAEKLRPQGAPIDWETSQVPVVTGMRVVSIGVKPPNPNAAKLLIDYVLSKEGQDLIKTFDRIPAHPDVDPLSPRLDPKKLKLHPAAPSLAEHADRHIKEFREIFGVQ